MPLTSCCRGANWHYIQDMSCFLSHDILQDPRCQRTVLKAVLKKNFGSFNVFIFSPVFSNNKQIVLLLIQVFLSLHLLKPYTDFHITFVNFISFQTKPISYFYNFLYFVIIT